MQQNELPPLTPAMIQRVREGVTAAGDRSVVDAIHNAFDTIEAIAQGGSDRRASGWVRRWVMRIFIYTLFRVRVEYPERIPKEPAMLAPNHLNHIDPFVILVEVPGHPYYYIPGDARTLYNHWWKRQILSFAGGVIPLERRWAEESAVIEAAKASLSDDSPLKKRGGEISLKGETGFTPPRIGRFSQGICVNPEDEDLADLAAAIEQNVPTGSDIHRLRQIDRAIRQIFAREDGMLIFPEGKLGNVEGQLQLPLARGTLIYALRAGVPIVPVALIGTQDLYFRKELTLRFGKWLRFPQSNRPKPTEIQTALEELQTALIALLPDNYQEPEEPKPLRDFLNHMFW